MPKEGPCLPLIGTSSLAMSLGGCRARTNPNRDRICCLTARLTGSVGGPGLVKVLGSSEHGGARRSEVGKSVWHAFKACPLGP
eukprot:scaffold280_cov391-Pavlova_lutheri.AAC.8